MQTFKCTLAYKATGGCVQAGNRIRREMAAGKNAAKAAVSLHLEELGVSFVNQLK